MWTLNVPSEGPDSRGQRSDEAELEIYRYIVNEPEADEEVNEVKLKVDGGPFASYLTELISQEEFIAKILQM